jgi:hypothetical protein
VFCPNCGTQNPDTAQTCSKCSFHLKGAAAPKFKGTMLMMNQPVVPTTGAPPPAAGAPPAQPGGPPRPSASGAPPGAAAGPSKLKGTMVGVAPMAGGMPPGGPMGAPKTPPPPAAPMAEANSAFSPPFPQPGGVNPLGGTVAADAGSFASAFGPGPGGAYAPPPQPAQPGYGAPPPGGQQGPGAFAATAAVPAGGGYGAPPPGYGAPPGGSPQGTAAQPAYGAPPPNAFGGGAPPGAPYGAPPPQGYGPPPPQPGFGPPPGYGQQQGYGGPPPGFGPPPGYGQAPGGQGYGAPAGGYGQAMQQAGPQAMGGYGQAGPMVGTLSSAGTKGPTRRNALMTLLLPFGVLVAGSILSTVLAMIVPSLTFLGSLVSLGGSVWFILITIPMVNELKSVTQNANLAWWPILIPFYSMYWAWLIIPAEVAKAKQMLGVQTPPRSLVLYIFLWPFALASDLNDMVR